MNMRCMHRDNGKVRVFNAFGIQVGVLGNGKAGIKVGGSKRGHVLTSFHNWSNRKNMACASFVVFCLDERSIRLEHISNTVLL